MPRFSLPSIPMIRRPMLRLLRDQTVRMLLFGFAVGTAGGAVIAPAIARADEAPPAQAAPR